MTRDDAAMLANPARSSPTQAGVPPEPVPMTPAMRELIRLIARAAIAKAEGKPCA